MYPKNIADPYFGIKIIKSLEKFVENPLKSSMFCPYSVFLLTGLGF